MTVSMEAEKFLLVGMVQNQKLVGPFLNQVSDTAWVCRQEGFISGASSVLPEFESVLQLIW